MSGAVVLEEVAAGSLDHLCHDGDIIRRVDATDDRSTELIIGGSSHDELDTASIDRWISLVDGCFDVPIESMLDIHGDVVDEIFIEQMLDHIWITPVGIEFDEESHILDATTKIRQIGMDGWFSSADDNPFEESDAFFEELEKDFFTDQIILEFHKVFS